jgi:N-acetylglucosamine-6-phosphate deacetylase
LAGHIVAPGLIDIQNNGSFGIDLSLPNLTAADVKRFRRGLLQHGVTAVCPTVVTSDPGTYREVLSLISPSQGGPADGELISAGQHSHHLIRTRAAAMGSGN